MCFTCQMKTLPNDDLLLADTKHARLMRDALAIGALRQWRLEYIIESEIEYRSSKPREIKKRREAREKGAEAALRLFIEYAADSPNPQAWYEVAQNIMSRRLADLTQKL